MASEKLVLSSVDMEANVLGCILLNHKYCLPKVCNMLIADDFYDVRHRLIYEACMKLSHHNKAVDSAMVVDVLGDKVDLAGGVSYISSLGDMIPSYRHVDEYAGVVKDLAERRFIMDGMSEFNYNVNAVNDQKAFYDRLDKLQRVIGVGRKRSAETITPMTDLIDRAVTELRTGTLTGVLTGYDPIDRATRGLQPGWFIIIAADSGEGKTALGMNICMKMAERGTHSLFFSCEMSNNGIVKRMISALSKVDISHTQDDMELNQEGRRRMDAAAKLYDMPISFDEQASSIDEIVAKTKAYRNELESKGQMLEVIFVDYIQLLKPTQRGRSREEEVAQISHGLKQLARECPGLRVVAMSQVNQKKKTDKRPLYALGDMRESQALVQDADLVIFISPDVKDKEKRFNAIHAGKHRETKGFYFNTEFLKECQLFVECDKN